MKDRWDFVEIEVKVEPAGRHAELVALVERVAPEGARMIRKPHVAFFDLYFDTPDWDLADGDAYLRARFDRRSFRKQGKYKLFYKDNPVPTPDARFLARREVRTDLTRDELLRAPEHGFPGAAGELAKSVLTARGAKGGLRPVCVVSSFRRYFTMRLAAAGAPDYLNLSIERSTALSAHDLDVELLIRSGFIDAPTSAQTLDFELCEAELTVENVPEAHAMFDRLVTALSEDFEILTESKYRQCLRGLGLRSTDSVHPHGPTEV